MFINLILLILQLLLMGTFGGGYYYPFLNLMVPFIILINCFFFIFWIIKLKWPFVMFVFSVLISYTEWERFYKLPNNGIPVSKGLKLMSFNVRLFNSYNWIDQENIPESILSFVNEESPDILCLQEFSKEFSHHSKVILITIFNLQAKMVKTAFVFYLNTPFIIGALFLLKIQITVLCSQKYFIKGIRLEFITFT